MHPNILYVQSSNRLISYFLLTFSSLVTNVTKSGQTFYPLVRAERYSLNIHDLAKKQLVHFKDEMGMSCYAKAHKIQSYFKYLVNYMTR